MPSDEIAKVCLRCKKSDITSFSKCRYCGSGYDAIVKDRREPGIDEKFIMAVCIAALGIGALIWAYTVVKEARMKRLSPIIMQVRAARKARVIEFYADWCGACRSYAPVIEACRAKYAGQLDFQRLNIDDAKNRFTAKAFGVSGIPMTCMFDSQGNEVAEVVGVLNSEQLDAYVQKLLKAK